MKKAVEIYMDPRKNYTYKKYRKIWADSQAYADRLILESAGTEPASLSEIKKSWRRQKNEREN